MGGAVVTFARVVPFSLGPRVDPDVVVARENEQGQGEQQGQGDWQGGKANSAHYRVGRQQSKESQPQPVSQPRTCLPGRCRTPALTKTTYLFMMTWMGSLKMPMTPAPTL